MEHVHYRCQMKEKEEEEQQQLQDDAALKGRQSLQHGKDSNVATLVATSVFSSAGDQPLLQEEEVLYTHQEEQKEQLTQKVDETTNIVAENDNSFNHDGEAVELGIIAEFVENVMNGEATINVASSQNKNSVYFDKQGNDIDGAKSVLPKSLGEGDFDIRGAAVDNCGDENSAKAYLNLTEEVDQQLKEFDVEAVLAKQETHDLFCPNCKSCITKRIILKKRKRSIPNLDAKAKRDKSATEVVDRSVEEANQGDHAIATPDVGRVEPPAGYSESEREQEVFRCLSCFSFFIPMRNGIKLFPSFGGKLETAQKPLVIPSPNVENPSIVVAASNNNWFSALFFSNKGRKTSAQGDASIVDSRNDNIESPLVNSPISQSLNLTPDIKPGPGGVNSSISSTVKSVVKNDSRVFAANVKTDVGDRKRDSVDLIKTDIVGDTSKPESVLVATVATTEILFNAGKPAKDAILKQYEGSPIFEKSQKDVNNKTLEIAQGSYSSLMKEAQAPDQSFGSEVVANEVACDKQSFRVDVTSPSILDFKEVQKDIGDKIKPSVAKEKEEAFKSSTSQTPAVVPTEGAIVTETHTEIYIGEQPRAEIGEHREWQILKSIIYGGLVESITSLGVVSSAAAAGSAPLNIVALGLANLIGGLFVIGHSLIDLKNDHSGGDSQQMNVQDRYRELLGLRANFLLHAVVAILSFLIFGSIPVVVYGLLIGVRYSDEVKVAAVAATSFICIIPLAIGKVYTSRPPKSYVKTVLQYVSLALATSGISYIAGNLVKDLLEKISGSESGNDLTMLLSGTTRMKPAWMSY
ncbi:hypothetical protein VNO78_01893 [Psophocarpus tetragonolobus]|uniref:Membrane protein of ER body-like protein n=1 Tax=Psophocarpus tetragonolobus TaxID=3891 RepID=A0AAN9SYB0_PSOTE